MFDGTLALFNPLQPAPVVLLLVSKHRQDDVKFVSRIQRWFLDTGRFGNDDDRAYF